MASSSQPEGDEYWKYIPVYNAALRSDWESANEIFERDKGAVTAKINIRLETALHVAVGAGGSPKAIDFVKNIVDKILTNMPLEAFEIPDLFGATALHNAAWFGNTKVARFLVEAHRPLLYISDRRDLSPLHLAAMNAHKETLSYLLEATTDDPVDKLFSNQSSGADFLMLVIITGFYDVALNLVHKYPSLAIAVRKDDNDMGLKAIARKVSAFRSTGSRHNSWQSKIYDYVPVNLEECTINPNGGDLENPISSKEVLAQKYNGAKSSPFMAHKHNWAQLLLEYCVPCIKRIREEKQMHLQALQLVRSLCREIRSLNDSNAYEFFAKDALLAAARLGIHEVIEEMVEWFPHLVWVQDWDGCNLIQRAVIERHENVFNLLYQMGETRQTMTKLKDNSLNNLLHLAGRLAPPYKLNLVSGAALQMQRELQWFKEVEKFANPSDTEWRDKNNDTPKMVFTKNHKNLVVEGEKWMKGTANSCAIPATLIAGMVFTAAINVPGGINGDGLPLFSTRLVFSIFVVSDAISLFTSTTSLLMFLSILTSRYAEADFLYVLPNRLIFGLLTLFLSITTMVVAFASALYLVLGHSKDWTLFPVAALACLPIFSFVSLQFPLLVDLLASTHGPGIFGRQSDRPFY